MAAIDGSGAPPRDPSSGILEKVIRLPPPTVWAADMAVPLPPVRWVSRVLGIAPGRPSVIVGQGGVRKGWLAMGCMLFGAAGEKLFGRVDFRPGLVSIYADYEQTERVTKERFQLLAGGHGIALSGLGKRLGYRWKPIPTWAPMASERTKALDTLCWHTEGVDLLVVDSLRACASGVEENSSAASAPLDLATEVSERTGVTVQFLDHSSGKAHEGTRRVDAQRGHSSKKDACQTLLVLSSSKGNPTLVTCERSQVTAEAEWPGDFQFTLQRAPGGVRLVEVQAAEPPTRDAAIQAVCTAFLAALKDGNEGCTSNEMASLLSVRKQDVLAARDHLERKGEIVNRGNASRPSWYLPSTDMGPLQGE